LKDVEEVRRIHNLLDLWKFVLAEAKPKIDLGTWDFCDIQFVEQCIVEFNERDETGFAFRYSLQGGERFDYDLAYFSIGNGTCLPSS
jgi:hypothetical protein